MNVTITNARMDIGVCAFLCPKILLCAPLIYSTFETLLDVEPKKTHKLMLALPIKENLSLLKQVSTSIML